MSRSKADCDELLAWLKGNLPRGALGALTGTDAKALAAAAHMLRLYAYSRDRRALEGFRTVVRMMQPSTREFAYHAIAYVSEWENRSDWWALAGLLPLEQVSVCAFEPTGHRRIAEHQVLEREGRAP